MGNTPEKITHKLYDGEIEIVFYPKSHQYRLNKKRLTSVTGISGIVDKSRVLLAWAARLADETGNAYAYKEAQKKAQGIGTEVHKFCEDFVNYKMGNGEMPATPENENVVNGAVAFMDWIESQEIEFIATERIVYSKKHNYVGLTDLLMRIDGKLILADFKTSKGFYGTDMGMQSAGYKIAYEEETGKKIDYRLVIRLDKETGAFSTHVMDNPKDDKAFLSALALKNHVKRMSKYE